jgi:hypothetical protein
MPRKTPDIGSADVPQAPNLARIRAIVTAFAAGAATIDVIAEETDISVRHVGHAARAAQALDLLDGKRAPTARGHALLATEQESADERAAFRTAVEASAIVRGLAPSLLAEKPPSKKTLAARIERLTGLSPSTAERRAEDLLAWREQILEED